MGTETCIEVNIAAVDDPAGGIAGLVRRLEAAGLEEANAQEELGTIRGRVREDRIADLERVPGVLAVERGRIVTILVR